MNIKKLFATLAGVSLFAQTVVPSAGVFGATYSQELQDAYNWAYGKGVTTMSSIDNANMYGAITRAEMAKMLSVYATEVLGYEADTSKACNFTDIDSVKGDLHDYIIKSCQLGLMGQGITAFRPYDTISRAEFGTALSRTLWGNQYEGGTPYYANHLNALKAAGIMNQIANAESTKEVRGYVMLMLMRSEGNDAVVDCDDPVIALACNLDSEDCPAACKSDSKDEDNKDEDEVVKSGSLVVSSSAADDRKVVVASGSTAVSDLDTLTFKTSEEVEITRVTLEKYGYSSASDLISNVWLEDENGKEVSNKAKPNTKGLVNLTIKKDYKAVDGTFNATIVVETKANAEVGGTVGFKVTDVNSTAKDVDLGNYKAYTYDVVRYDGTKATITAKGWDKDYNYEEGKALEVSKFKIKAPDDSSITVNGFTLTDTENMDIYDNFDVDSIEVTVDGEAVKANADLTKKEELTISFKNSIEIAAKQKVEVVVTTKLNSDFEDYGKKIKLIVKNESDLSATDKNNARVTVDNNTNFVRYIINGGKVKISSTKLGNIEAAINSTDVKLAEWEITVSEAIEGTLTITAQWDGVAALDTMRLEIAGDEYDGTPRNNKGTWTFDNIEVSKSGKIRLYVDILEATSLEGKSITFSIDGWKDLNYVDGQDSDKIDVSGSLNISKLTLTQARGTLVNNLSSSDDIEFPNKELNTFVVFDGTYTAKKQNINLNSFTIKWNNTGNSTIRFYLYVDDMKDSVADVKLGTGSGLSGSDSFNDILVKAGESVKVKVEAEVDAKEPDNGTFKRAEIGKFTLVLEGEDENDNPNGGAEKSTSKIVIVKKGSVSVSETSTAAKLVLRKSSDAKVAEVTVKPDGSNTVTLESINFDIKFSEAYNGEVKLYVDGSNEDLVNSSNKIPQSYAKDATTALSAELNKTVESEGIAIRIELEDEYEGTVTINNLKVNDKEVKKEFVKRFEKATIWFSNQSSTKIDTKFTFGVDKKSSDSIENVRIYTGNVTRWVQPTVDASWISVKNGNEVKAGDTFSVLWNANNSYYITAIAYTINGGASTTTAGTQAVLTGTLTSALTAPVNAGTQYSGDWYYQADAASWDNEVTLVHSGTAIATDPIGSGYTLAGGTFKVKIQWIAPVTSVDPSSYIVVTKADFDDYFKVNLKDDGDYISIAKAD